MKYCSNCGKEIDEKAVICPNCGAQVGEIQAKPVETNTLGILAIVFSMISVVIGMVLSIIGLCTYKLPENKKYCKIALIISIIMLFIAIIFIICFMTGSFGSVNYNGTRYF